MEYFFFFSPFSRASSLRREPIYDNFSVSLNLVIRISFDIDKLSDLNFRVQSQSFQLFFFSDKLSFSFSLFLVFFFGVVEYFQYLIKIRFFSRRLRRNIELFVYLIWLYSVRYSQENVYISIDPFQIV